MPRQALSPGWPELGPRSPLLQEPRVTGFTPERGTLLSFPFPVDPANSAWDLGGYAGKEGGADQELSIIVEHVRLSSDRAVVLRLGNRLEKTTIK